LKQRFPLRAKIAPITAVQTNCLPAAGHFTASSGLKPATCIRARLCRMTSPKPWSPRIPDSRTLIHSYGLARIAPGFDPALKAAFEAVGLADVLH
jgi:hypothetical protein